MPLADWMSKVEKTGYSLSAIRISKRSSRARSCRFRTSSASVVSQLDKEGTSGLLWALRATFFFLGTVGFIREHPICPSGRVFQDIKRIHSKVQHYVFTGAR